MYVSNDILNSRNVMGLLILVLDTYVFLLVLDAVIFSLPHFISVIGDIPLVRFSSCQRNLIKTFQIERMIALITKMTLVYSSDLLNSQK